MYNGALSFLYGDCRSLYSHILHWHTVPGNSGFLQQKLIRRLPFQLLLCTATPIVIFAFIINGIAV